MKCAISEPRVRTFNSTAFDNPAGLRLRLFLLAQWSKPTARSGEDALVLRACHPDPSMERLIASSRVPGPRNVQKQNRSWSSCLAMIIAEHSAESLTPFDSGVRFANGAERPQQAVF